MSTIEHKIAAEVKVRELLKEQDVPPPDEIEYGHACIRLLWNESKVALVVDLEDDPDEEPTTSATRIRDAARRTGRGSGAPPSGRARPTAHQEETRSRARQTRQLIYQPSHSARRSDTLPRERRPATGAGRTGGGAARRPAMTGGCCG